MNRDIFDKNNTKALHGLAILMMIYHHLFLEGNNWNLGEKISLFDYFNFLNFGIGDTFQLTIAFFCKICVAIFAFTSGYGMYIQLDKKFGKNAEYKEMYKYCFGRLFSFYKKFFIAFAVFVSICYFEGNPYGFNFALPNFILNLLGLKSEYNATWWYVAVYYGMILASPILYKVLKGEIKPKYIYICILSGICFVAAVFVYAYYIHDFDHYFIIFKNLILSAYTVYPIIFAEGMIIARFSILGKFTSRLNLLLSIFILVMTFILRTLLISVPSDMRIDIILIVPFILGVSMIFSYSKYLKKFFMFFGGYSTYMWYSHPYFYSYLFYIYVMRSNLSLVIYIQVVLYSLFASVALSLIENYSGKLLKRIRH